MNQCPVLREAPRIACRRVDVWCSRDALPRMYSALNHGWVMVWHSLASNKKILFKGMKSHDQITMLSKSMQLSLQSEVRLKFYEMVESQGKNNIGKKRLNTYHQFKSSLNSFYRLKISESFMELCINRPFPSCLLPLFQNESWCTAFVMEMSLICIRTINVQVKLISIWKVVHQDSFWNRGKKQLGMAYYKPIEDRICLKPQRNSGRKRLRVRKSVAFDQNVPLLTANNTLILQDKLVVNPDDKPVQQNWGEFYWPLAQLAVLACCNLSVQAWQRGSWQQYFSQMLALFVMVLPFKDMTRKLKNTSPRRSVRFILKDELHVW